MKRLVRNLVALVALLAAGLAFAQTPPQNGVYTFQGQGNLTSIITSLANPALNQIPIGNGQNGYSLLTPTGDFGPSGALGNYHVVGAHFNVQTCSTSPCTVISAIVQCNASSGAITLNLPGAGGTGYWTWIQKTDSTSNACAVTPAGSDTINGSAGALSLTVQSVSLYLDDAASGNWIATSGQVPGSIVGQGTFPLTTTGNFNNWSGTNANTLNLVQLTAPTPTITSTCSGTCATTYTYEITCLGDNSTHTAPSASETCTNAASLSGSNFCSLNWTAGTGCYNGYNVYGRVSGSLGLLATVTGTSYSDTGTASPGAAPPSTNTTGSVNTAGNATIGGALNVTGASTFTGTTTLTGGLNTPLSIANGGNGTASPALTAGTGITLGGAWPTQSIAVNGAANSLIPHGAQLYTSSGTFTVPANVYAIEVQCWGPGGGGGGFGTSATFGGNGTADTTVIANATTYCDGGPGSGGGGTSSGIQNGGSPGSASNGVIALGGSGGFSGNVQKGNGTPSGGAGGSAPLGGGLNTYGNGGTGGGNGSFSAGAGGGGSGGYSMDIIATTPSSTFTITVGTGGAAGTGGTQNGLAGTNGAVLVTW